MCVDFAVLAQILSATVGRQCPKHNSALRVILRRTCTYNTHADDCDRSRQTENQEFCNVQSAMLASQIFAVELICVICDLVAPCRRLQTAYLCVHGLWLACRTVSRNSGEDLALHFESSFYETSAADDYESVEQVFVDIVREMARVYERQMPLQALFISEDRSAASAVPYRRYKPVKLAGSAVSSPSEPVKKDSKDESKLSTRRTAAPFKFFNKGFKIFN